LLLKYTEAHNAGNVQLAKLFRDKAISEHDIGDKIIERIVDDGIQSDRQARS
jgi:hypothetical protein